jgi:hypothetical protein
MQSGEGRFGACKSSNHSQFVGPPHGTGGVLGLRKRSCRGDECHVARMIQRDPTSPPILGTPEEKCNKIPKR